MSRTEPKSYATAAERAQRPRRPDRHGAHHASHRAARAARRPRHRRHPFERQHPHRRRGDRRDRRRSRGARRHPPHRDDHRRCRPGSPVLRAHRPHDRNRDGRMTTAARTRRLLAGEARKAASTPVTYGFLAAILAFTALNTSLSLSDATAGAAPAPGVRHVFSAGRDFLFLFIALGAVGAAGEFRHGTALPTFLATPARWRVLVAKLAAHLGLGAIVAATCVAVEMAIALPWIDAQ